MTGTLWHVTAALLAFLVTHSLPALKPVRARFVTLLGERAYLLIYSLLSITAITWVVLALVDAPYVEMWPMTVPTMWFTAALMLPATVFLVFGLTTPNPFSIPVRPDSFDPQQPKFLAVSRHPILMGLALWAIAHVPPNGAVATVMMFGFAAAFSLAGMKILDARRKRAWGREAWQTKAAHTALLNWTAITASRAVSWKDWRWILTSVVYIGLILAHPLIVGVSPSP